jgi:PilZ domain
VYAARFDEMGTLEFLGEFKTLHEKVKKGALTLTERARYDMARAQLGRMVLLSQQLTHGGDPLRSSLRMAKMLKVEVRPDEGDPIRASTIDLASGGFAILLPTGIRVGKGAGFTLYLPGTGGGSAPITGRAAVASSIPQTALFRVSFRFENLHPSAQEQLDMVLIDAILERFTRL